VRVAFTDRDFYKPVVRTAVDDFGLGTLALILNVPEAEVARWAQGRSRPPTHLLLQLVDLVRATKAEQKPTEGRGVTRVLVATAPSARRQLGDILAHCPVEFACSFHEGLQALERRSYSHVVIGSLFADSQMFEFARAVRDAQPSARVICVKGAGRSLGCEVRRGLDAAVRELGCEGFFDLTAGDVPETFNEVFSQVLARFALDKEQIPERETVVGKLRTAVQALRSHA
jgi:hypothetical protein